jgi:hypothetical protein
MARPQVADGVDGLQMWRVAENMLRNQSRIADKGWCSSLEGWARGQQLLTVKEQLVTDVTQGLKIKRSFVNTVMMTSGQTFNDSRRTLELVKDPYWYMPWWIE